MIFAMIWLTYLVIGAAIVLPKSKWEYDETLSKIVIWPVWLYCIRGETRHERKQTDEMKKNPLDY